MEDSSLLFRRSALEYHFGSEIQGEVLRPSPPSSRALSSFFPLRRRSRVPFIPQMEMAECGAACLAMVMAHHGHHAPLSEVREACGVSRDGASARALAEAAQAYGFDAEGVKLEAEDLDALPLPAILHWGFSHFVVLESVDGKGGATLVDPGSGTVQMPREEVDRNFTGVALLLQPGEGFQPRTQPRPGLSRYGRLVRRHLPGLARVLGLSLALQAAAVSVPLCVQLTLDRAVMPRQPGWLPLFVAAASLIAAGTILLTWLRSRTVQQLQVTIDRDLMTRFVDHLLRLPTGFFLQRQPGDVAQRVRTNATLRDLLSSRSVSAVFDALLLAAYLALMVTYSVRLALVVVAAAALRLGSVLLLRESRQRILGAELAASGRESAALVEGLVGIEGLRASGSEARMLHRWAKFATQRVNATAERRVLESGSEQLMVLLRGAALAAVLWIGGGEVLSGRMTLGGLAALLTLESAFLVPLADLLTSLGHFQYLRTHLARLDDILGASPEPSGSLDPGRLRGAIRMEDVSFRYSRWAPFEIQGVSLDIRPGEKIALVGPSGAGKSTLARLLLGLLQPTEGTIRFDGHDLRELDLRRVRRQIGAVLQETFLFDGTVRANLTLAASRASMERLERAVRLAACDEVVAALPEGYDTPIGEGGARLSGGQRQRLCLARALLGEPAILLLDEATSSLDRETERRVHRNLAAFGCTRIVIAHRLETVMDADRILVVQGGRIVQEGSYAGLAGQPGLFRDLVSAKESHAASG